jgi:hypothetical protein
MTHDALSHCRTGGLIESKFTFIPTQSEQRGLPASSNTSLPSYLALVMALAKEVSYTKGWPAQGKASENPPRIKLNTMRSYFIINLLYVR